MTWRQLHSRIGRQPLSVTQHNRVRAVIDGHETFLNLKFDERGLPYLAESNTDNDKKARN